MKTQQIIACFCVMFFGLTSCQKVIKITPDSKDAQLVIEAELTDDSSVPATVQISKTVNLDQGNDFPGVSGAVVTISDNAGNTATLTETSPGLYSTMGLQGVSGRTYFLTVATEGNSYTATCAMPFKVPLDTLLVEGDKSKRITPVFQDPAGRGNYYRMKLQTNGVYSRTIFLFDDELTDGDVNNRSLLDLGGTSLETGDVVKVEMMCIDKAINKYFFSLSQNGVGPGASATPANPVTNISGQVLGYFSAHTLQQKTIVIP